MSIRPRWTMRGLNERRRDWEALEHSANERAYARWMREQEAGDAARDAREERNVSPEERARWEAWRLEHRATGDQTRHSDSDRRTP